MKVLAASITAKWIVRPSWIEASKKAGYIVPEVGHGIRHTERPFKGVAFFLTPAYVKENFGGQFDASCCQSLIQVLGKGRLVKDMNQAKYILAADSEKDGGKGPKIIHRKDFLRMIPAYRQYEIKK
jgi:hypothetical protein